MFSTLCESVTGAVPSGSSLHNHVHQLLTYVNDIAVSASDKASLGMALRSELLALHRHIVDNIATELNVPKMWIENMGLPQYVEIILSDFVTSVTVGAGGSWAGLEASIGMAIMAITGEVYSRV